MDINRIFTVLTRGKGTLRRVFSTKNNYPKDRLHEALVPAGIEGKYTDYAAEQLIQNLIRSRFASEVEALDPLSMYVRQLEFPTDFSYIMRGIPEDKVEIIYKKQNQPPTVISRSAVLQIKADELSARFLAGDRSGEDISYTVSGNLSSDIELNNGLSLRLKYPLSGMYNITLDYVFPYRRSLVDINNGLPPLHGPYADYSSLSMPDKLAGLTFELCKELLEEGYG